MGLVISLIHSFKSSIRDLLIMPQVAIWCAPALDCNPHVKHVYGHRRRMVYLMASVGSSSSAAAAAAAATPEARGAGHNSEDICPVYFLRGRENRYEVTSAPGQLVVVGLLPR
jgi:hypothetical protein